MCTSLSNLTMEKVLSSKIGPAIILVSLAALSIMGRVWMAEIPNVQPSTVLIIIASLLWGARYGLAVAVATVLGSNLFLGHGPWTYMQIVAWGSIALFAGLLHRRYKNIPFFVLASLAALTGYLYGLIISLPMLAGGLTAFVLYYKFGILFDGFHAAGNLAFFLLLAKPLLRLLDQQEERAA